MPSQTQREGSNIDGRAIAVGALGVLLIVVMVSALVRLLAALDHTSIVPARRVAQPPALSDPDPADRLRAYESAQQLLLHGYGWQDASHAYAHIPIERAMQLLLQNGQSSHSPPAAGAHEPPP